MNENDLLRAEVEQVTWAATAWLEQHHGGGFDRAVSVGLLGSWARGDASEVSDIDYYVVFDAGALGLGGDASEQLAACIAELEGHVERTFARSAMTGRFSVFWTTVEQLRGGCYAVGRFPAYDRYALCQQARHLGGRPLDTRTLAQPAFQELIEDGARFVVTTMRQKLDRSAFFARLPALRGDDIAAMDDVVVSKVVLMPVRLLYMTLGQARERPVASVEYALAACDGAFGDMSWWPLASAGLEWRRHPPRDPAHRQVAAALLRAHVPALYACMLERYRRALVGTGAGDLLERLIAFGDQIEGGRRATTRAEAQ